jgi:hypothetical protein
VRHRFSTAADLLPPFVGHGDRRGLGRGDRHTPSSEANPPG